MTDEPKDDLRACPFCGGRGLLHRAGLNRLWAVSCVNCDARRAGSIGDDGSQAIAAWNTRPEPAPSADLARQVEVLREAARSAHDTLIELNPSNYSHDDVCEANDAAVEAIFLLADALGETHGKSAEWWNARRAALNPGGDHA